MLARLRLGLRVLWGVALTNCIGYNNTQSMAAMGFIYDLYISRFDIYLAILLNAPTKFVLTSVFFLSVIL